MRRFAAWLSATDPRTEIPPPGLLPERYRRRPPYIYSDEEIARIVREAARLPSPSGLRAHTYATLFGLLAATGLRLGEALALDRDDVDLHAGVLAVRRAKFGKSRFVPVHDSTRRALRRYAQQRDVLLPRPASPAFFLSERGTRRHAVQCRVQLRGRLPCRRPAPADTRTSPWPRTAAPRHAPPTRREDARPLVPRGTRRRARAAQALHLPRARPRRRHLLVHRGRPRTPPARHRAGDRPAGRKRHERPRLPRAAAGLLHRPPASAAAGEPAHGGRLPQHLPPAPALRRRRDSAAPRPASCSRTSTPPSSASSSTTSSGSAATAPAAATPASRRSTPSSATSRFTEPAHALHCQRVLAIPSKRFERGIVEFLDEEEVDALLDAPDPATWIGRRDRALLARRRPDGPARLRADRASPPGRDAWHRRPRPLPRQGAEAPLHAAAPRRREDPRSMAA